MHISRQDFTGYKLALEQRLKTSSILKDRSAWVSYKTTEVLYNLCQCPSSCLPIGLAAIITRLARSIMSSPFQYFTHVPPSPINFKINSASGSCVYIFTSRFFMFFTLSPAEPTRALVFQMLQTVHGRHPKTTCNCSLPQCKHCTYYAVNLLQ